MRTEASTQTQDFQEQLDAIKVELTLLREAIESLTNTCSKMGDHIVFVEDTYAKLRAPLEYVRSKFPGGTPLPELSQ
jgi:septation ring formation regulator EzrA